MKSKLLFFTLAFFFPTLTNAETILFSPPKLASIGPIKQIPADWKIIKQLKADLNSDGLEDLIYVLERTLQPEDWPPRVLAIYFKNPNGQYSKSIQSQHAIMCSLCGGMMGDPFSDLQVTKKGVIVISHYGGSRDRWAFVHRWRYQDGAWKLIGFTKQSNDNLTLSGLEVDTNLITGKQIITHTQEDKVQKQEKQIPIKDLIRLESLKEFLNQLP